MNAKPSFRENDLLPREAVIRWWQHITMTASAVLLVLSGLCSTSVIAQVSNAYSGRITALNAPGLKLDHITRINPQTMMKLTSWAGCDVSPPNAITFLSNTLGPLMITEYTISTPCVFKRGAPALAGFGQLETQYGSNHMGFAYAPGQRDTLLRHLSQ